MSKKTSVVGALVMGTLLVSVAAPTFADVANGEKLYKREGCQGCHGPTLTGAAGIPNLIASPKTATKEDFQKAVLDGNGAMAVFKNNEKVKAGIDDLYEFISSKK